MDLGAIQNKNRALLAVTATQVNTFHNTIDISTEAGKKLYQQATKGLPDEEKCDENPKGIIKFMKKVESETEECVWKSIEKLIGPDNVKLLETPGKLTVEV